MSILAITALGVTVLTGIYAACQDMYDSADRFYDEQNLYDIRVLSTLGLTQEDVAALQAVAGVAMAEGGYEETVYTEFDGVRYTVKMSMMGLQGMNMPYVVEGKLPSQAGEIAVTGKYLAESGKSVGDILTIDEKTDSEEEANQETAEAQTKAEIEAEAEAKTADDGNTGTEVSWDTEVEIEEEETTPVFLNQSYIITAEVIDPMDISNNDAAFRSSSTAADYNFFVTSEDIDSDIYTCVYITLEGMKELDCHSAAYEEAVAAVIKRIESEIMGQREEARYQSIRGEALEKITDAEQTMNEKFAEADEKFTDAWQEVTESRQELFDGEQELIREEQDALQKIADAWQELFDGEQELLDAEAELQQGEQDLAWAMMELDNNAWLLEEGMAELQEARKQAEAEFAAAEAELAQKQKELDRTRAGLEAGISQLKMAFVNGWPETEWNALVTAVANETVRLSAADPNGEPDANAVAGATQSEQGDLAGALTVLAGSGDGTDTGNPAVLIPDCIKAAIGLGMVNGGQQVLNEGRRTYEKMKADALQQMADAEAEIRNGEKQLEEGREQLNQAAVELEDGKKKLAEGQQELAEGREELTAKEANAKQEIADAWQEIAEGKEELAKGEAELTENQTEYFVKKEEAQEKLADAWQELADIDMTQWYVQDRNNLDSYSSLKSDMSSIESIGAVFPVVFLVVAVLISLTTMTRMIEEERGLIGTYKALGFGDGAIYFKYLLYAFCACLLGGFVGDLCGFIALPGFLLFVLRKLYILPHVSLRFDAVYGFGGILLFMAGIMGATVMVCQSELKHMPSVLMRPKAPRNGSRVLLERIPFIWQRLTFLNKVTVRNLFRYKKRFFMTVLGIMGCTALVLAGFAIKDTVTALVPRQYENIYQYDLMLVVDEEDNEELLGLAEADQYIEDYVNLGINSVKVYNEAGASESVQLMVMPDAETLAGYIRTIDTDKVPVLPDASGILLTRNAAWMLGVEAGDTVILQNLVLDQGSAEISCVVENYLGNNVYMTREVYETLFEPYKPNGILAHIAPACDDPVAYAESFLDQDMILTSVGIAGVKADFATNFALVNTVVYVLILLAAGLAFVVLFTLSNTNISERVRELATTKVLGFYDREVHSYVNKETLILTAIGVLAGLPAGWYLSHLLTNALKMPSIYFATYIEPVSYIYAAIISFSFALIVNLITNRTLNRINMVEALKSVE